MDRDWIRLLAQPFLFSMLYVGGSILVTLFDFIDTFWHRAIVAIAFLIGSYSLVTRFIPVLRPDRPVTMTRHESVDDVVFKNDAKLALSVVIPALTLLPFLFIPLSTYTAIGVDLVGFFIVGRYLSETWIVYRLTAQYLPNYSPHLFGDDYEPPFE